jgi:hypothetical protein
MEEVGSQEGDIETCSTIRCPFYGFSYHEHEDQIIFLGSRNNQCPLSGKLHLDVSEEEKSISPCRMEVEGEMPDWERCNLNNTLDMALHFHIFAKKAHVKPADSEREIPFVNWHLHVMGYKPLSDSESYSS